MICKAIISHVKFKGFPSSLIWFSSISFATYFFHTIHWPHKSQKHLQIFLSHVQTILIVLPHRCIYYHNLELKCSKCLFEKHLEVFEGLDAFPRQEKMFSWFGFAFYFDYVQMRSHDIIMFEHITLTQNHIDYPNMNGTCSKPEKNIGIGLSNRTCI